MPRRCGCRASSVASSAPLPPPTSTTVRVPLQSHSTKGGPDIHDGPGPARAAYLSVLLDDLIADALSLRTHIAPAELMEQILLAEAATDALRDRQSEIRRG
jgi:hypothetical protein